MIRSFKTKRQRRERRLWKLTDQQWATLPGFLILFDEQFSTGQDSCGELIPLNEETLPSRSTDPKFRGYAVEAWLDCAEEGPEFAKKLDRFLRLRTDDEDHEYHDHWTTKRNKAYYLFAILAFVISVISLCVSLRR